MDFSIVGSISQIEVIAEGRGIRDLRRLKRIYGGRRWRKLKGLARIRLKNGEVRLAEIALV